MEVQLFGKKEGGNPGSHNLFGQKVKVDDNSKDLGDMMHDLNNLSRRLRVIEEANTNSRRKIQLTEQNMISKNKTFSSEIKTINSDISELKKEISEIRDKFMLMVKELELRAKKEDVEVMKKYIQMWQPVKFVTENDVKDIIKRYLEDKKG